MPINFPNSPSINDTYTFEDKSWVYNGRGWAAQPLPSILSVANAAYDVANTASEAANAAYSVANTAYDAANAAYGVANSAYDAANTASNTYLTVAVSDETTDLTIGAGKTRFRAPFGMTIYQIPRASLNVASSSGEVVVDINAGGTSILGANKLSIDADEKTSTTAAVLTTLATTTISDDAEITIDIDSAGTGAKGLKVTLYFRRT